VHPHTLCKHKLLFWMRLIAINRLTALKSSQMELDKNYDKPVGKHFLQQLLCAHISEHSWPLCEFQVFVNLMRLRKDCSSAPMQPLWRWMRVTTETEISQDSSMCPNFI